MFQSDNVVSYLCWKCLNAEIITSKDIQNEPSYSTKENDLTPKAKGWHFMSEYVDQEGNVYFKGKVQPELKGTRPVTIIDEEKKAEQKLQSKITELGELIREKDDLFAKIIGFYYAKKGDKKKISQMEKRYNDLYEQIAKIYRMMPTIKL